MCPFSAMLLPGVYPVLSLCVWFLSALCNSLIYCFNFTFYLFQTILLTSFLFWILTMYFPSLAPLFGSHTIILKCIIFAIIVVFKISVWTWTSFLWDSRWEIFPVSTTKCEWTLSEYNFPTNFASASQAFPLNYINLGCHVRPCQKQLWLC